MLIDEGDITASIVERHRAFYEIGVKAFGKLDEKYRRALGVLRGSNDEECGMAEAALRTNLYTLVGIEDDLGIDLLHAACGVEQFAISLLELYKVYADKRDLPFVPHTLAVAPADFVAIEEPAVRYQTIASRISAAIGTDEETAGALLDAIVGVLLSDDLPQGLPPYRVLEKKEGIVYLICDPNQ